MMPRQNFSCILMGKVWGHRNFVATLELLKALAMTTLPGSVILVVGASGAGKTTLLKQTMSQLVDSPDRWPAGTMPVVSSSISNDVQGLFNSKNFVLRLLHATDHPFYCGDPSCFTSTVPDQRGKNFTLERLRLRHSEPHLWIALEKAVEHRQVKYIFLDEGNHLIKAGSDRKAVDNLDCIKGFAERTGSIIFLFATFEILAVWNRSAQLNRRLQDVVLHRYYKDRPEDVEEFARILQSFSELLPPSRKATLLDHIDFIYESTLGIIGEVVRLLVGAYARMVASEASAVTKQMLRDAAHSPTKIETLRREALGGEAMLLGDIPEVPDRAILPRMDQPLPNRKGRRGRRNPVRDPVGKSVSRAIVRFQSES